MWLTISGVFAIGCNERPVPGSGADWTSAGGDAAVTKYSALDQIHAGNVTELQQAWVFHSAGPYLRAVDIATGRGGLIWRFRKDQS